MKRKIIGILLLSCTSSYTIATENSATTTEESIDWQLVWNDEFNYQGLPDPKKWGYEEGFIRNNEEQYYTVNRIENARVENGNLVIEGRKETYSNANYQADSDDWRINRKEGKYTSASITTLGKASWTYGKIEVRAKLPQGKGVWPAIWTLGENRIPPIGESKTGTVTWPFCGEIDIMEFVGKEPNHIYGTIHFADLNNKHKSDGGKIDFKLPPVNDFHTYTAEWNKDNIKFFIDGKMYHTADTTKSINNAFDKPHYLLINLALGGAWGGELDENILPQKYLVDYVRVYQK
ncbi:glycoside hydrolase family 16 protein [Vibrio mimicus]